MSELNENQNQDYKNIAEYKICKVFEVSDYGTDFNVIVNNKNLYELTSSLLPSTFLMTDKYSNREKVALCCKTLDSCVVVGILDKNGPELMSQIGDSSEYELIRL